MSTRVYADPAYPGESIRLRPLEQPARPLGHAVCNLPVGSSDEKGTWTLAARTHTQGGHHWLEGPVVFLMDGTLRWYGITTAGV